MPDADCIRIYSYFYIESIIHGSWVIFGLIEIEIGIGIEMEIGIEITGICDGEWVFQ